MYLCMEYKISENTNWMSTNGVLSVSLIQRTVSGTRCMIRAMQTVHGHMLGNDAERNVHGDPNSHYAN